MRDVANTSWVDTETLLFRGVILEPNSTFSLDPANQDELLPPSINVVRGVCLVVISVMGFIFNIFMIVAIVPNRRLRTVRNILLVHLGVVGLLSSVFTTLYPALATFHGTWIGGTPMCLAYIYITCVFTSVSVWTIATLSWDKYQTIAVPLHHSLSATSRKMFPCFSIFWMCGLTLALPPLFGSNEFSFHSQMGICGLNVHSTGGRWYICMQIFLSFIFPFCVIIYCYAHIFRIARTQSSRIAATMLRMVSLIQAPIAPSSHTSINLRGTKAMGTILQLIGSFILTYLPYVILNLYEAIFAVHANTIFVSIATTLFLAAPFTHAAIYGIRNKILRTSFHRYVRRKVQHCCAKDKRRGSVRSLTRKSSAALKIPLKSIVRNDEKKCILQRTLSSYGRPVDIQSGAFENKATCLSSPHEYDPLGKSNGYPAARFDDSILEIGCSTNEDRKHMKEVSFCAMDDVSYVQNDIVSDVSKHELSFYSKDALNEMNDVDWDMDELTKYEKQHEEVELTLFHQPPEDDLSLDIQQEEPSILYPIKEILASFQLRRSQETTGLLKEKSKYGRTKIKSKYHRQMLTQEESSIFRVGHLDSEFQQEFVDVEVCQV